MKKFLALLLVFLCIFGCISCNKKTDVNTDNDLQSGTPSDETEEEEIDISKLMPVAVCSMDSGETFEIELYKDIAPITVNNFIKLIKSGFYDGTLIHRITSSGIFVIQGGGYFLDSNSQQYSKSAETIYGEFTSNGFTNNLSHEEGVISMARLGGQNDSASSQFFICYEDSSQIDGDYATFGKIRKGLEIVKDIANSPKSGETPISTIIIKTITLKYVEM